MREFKVLLGEFMPARGHRRLLLNTYDLLSSTFITSLVAPRDAIGDKASDVFFLPNGYYDGKSTSVYKFLYLWTSLMNIRYIYSRARKCKFDAIVCLTFDDFSLFIASFLLRKPCRVFIMHHNNLDKIKSSKFRRWCFKRIWKEYTHIVQCGFMASGLHDIIGIPMEDIIIWPHPLNISSSSNQEQKIKDIDCVGISNSNDESIIQQLIESEKVNSIFKNNGLRVVLRSRVSCYDNGYLKVINGRLDTTEYDELINRAKSIFIPFPQSFGYRMSGTLVDALTNDKLVIATNIMLIQESRKKYPNIIKIYNKDDIVKLLTNIFINDKMMEEFNDFRSFHSFDSLSSIISKTLESSLNGSNCRQLYDF